MVRRWLGKLVSKLTSSYSATMSTSIQLSSHQFDRLTYQKVDHHRMCNVFVPLTAGAVSGKHLFRSTVEEPPVQQLEN